MVTTANRDVRSKTRAQQTTGDTGKTAPKPFYRSWTFLLGIAAVLLVVSGMVWRWLQPSPQAPPTPPAPVHSGSAQPR